LLDGHKKLVLQPRDIALLEHLSRLRILDRRQIQVLAGFHSTSRVNVRLSRLRKAGLLARYFTSTTTGSKRSIYGLTKKGAVTITAPYVPLKWQPNSFLIGNAFVAHQLALNYIYMSAAQQPIQWNSALPQFSPSVPLIPDALIETSDRALFLEVDLGTEPLSVWTRKAGLYLKFAVSGAYREITQHPTFSVLCVTPNESRMHSLRNHIAKQTPKLFWFSTLDTIKRLGFWSAFWLRASGEDHCPPGG
jgi:hypothetical protein